MVKKQQMISLSTMIIISLLVGVIIGFSIGNSPSTVENHDEHNIVEDGHDHSTHEHTIHSHETMDLSGSWTVPTLEIQVIEDSKSGYNLEIDTTNFEFISTAKYDSQTSSDSDHTAQVTSGHAHLYINGEKITRIYSNSYYLGELEGYNEITVTLNSNDHKDYSISGEVISATHIVMVE